MKKIIFPLMALIASSVFTSNGYSATSMKTSEVLSKLQSITCQYTGSSYRYSIAQKKVVWMGRTSDSVYPITNIVANDTKNTITIMYNYAGKIDSDEFSVSGQPFKSAVDNSLMIDLIGPSHQECVGYLK